MIDCEHEPKVHRCHPPDDDPYMVICARCHLVLWGHVTDEQAASPDIHPTLEAAA